MFVYGRSLMAAYGTLYAVPMGVAICAKVVQPLPWQRSTRYPVTPTLSVEAVQERLICEELAGAAIKLDGAVGGVVSDEACVLAEIVLE